VGVTPANPKRSGNPATRATAADHASATRVKVAEHSRGLLVRLSQLPPLVVPVVTLVLMLIGLLAPLYVAVPALVLVAAFVLWLAYISWPALDSGGRMLRLVMVAAIAVALVGRISGWL
jgi:hypothetical protein